MTTQSITVERDALPSSHLDYDKMPGHWLLANLGKRVLRPGGLEMTKRMLENLDIQQEDSVVEFAPGLGITAAMILEKEPKKYTAIERDEKAAQLVRSYLKHESQICVLGKAEDTGLADVLTSVILGEAMLSMQTPKQKADIVKEAARLLQKGGRYGIHELCLVPDSINISLKEEIETSLKESIRVGARPLTLSEWKKLLEDEGFVVKYEMQSPMHLLEPKRFIQDEGFFGTLRFLRRLLSRPKALKRVFKMRGVFFKYRKHLSAVMLVAEKK